MAKRWRKWIALLLLVGAITLGGFAEVPDSSEWGVDVVRGEQRAALGISLLAAGSAALLAGTPDEDRRTP